MYIHIFPDNNITIVYSNSLYAIQIIINVETIRTNDTVCTNHGIITDNYACTNRSIGSNTYIMTNIDTCRINNC